MSEPVNSPSQGSGNGAQIDPLKFQRLMQQIRDNQNIALGALAGAAAAVTGAVVWAAITAVTNYQIGWMAIGVGLLVAFAVRFMGRGVDTAFGVVGAVFSLLGCLAGNLLTLVIVIADQQGMTYLDVLSRLTPDITLELIQATFHPMDALFYGLALYVGYRYAFRTVSDTELSRLTS